MRKTLLGCVLVPLLLAPAAPAQAGSPTVEGRRCSYVAIDDPGPQAGHNSLVLEVNGGPVAAADLSDVVANPVTVTLTCTIQIDAWTHAGPDRAVVSGSGSVVATAGPEHVLLDIPFESYIVLCSAVTVTDAGGTTHQLYWDGSARQFTTSADAACPDRYDPCGLECPPWSEVLDLVDSVFVDHVDPTACPAFAAQSPGIPGVVDITPEGDVHLAGYGFFWDCPPYEL